MDSITKQMLEIIKRLYASAKIPKKQTQKANRRITVVHILYQSYPTGFTKDSTLPSELICWPVLADNLSKQYAEDQTINFTQIIINIDKRFGIVNEDLTTAIEKKIMDIQFQYPRCNLYYKNIQDMFINSSTCVNQLKLLSNTLPDDVALNFIYCGTNFADLNCNPFQLFKHNPRIFVPLFDGIIYGRHMIADITFDTEYTSIKWQPSKEWYDLEITKYKIPGLLKLINLRNKKFKCPISNSDVDIHSMIDVPLTHASPTMSSQKIELLKSYLKICLSDSEVVTYFDELIDKITSTCIIDILQTYIIRLGGASGADSFQHSITIMSVMLLETLADYWGYPSGLHDNFKPIITAISMGKLDELCAACLVLEELIKQPSSYD